MHDCGCVCDWLAWSCVSVGVSESSLSKEPLCADGVHEGAIQNSIRVSTRHQQCSEWIHIQYGGSTHTCSNNSLKVSNTRQLHCVTSTSNRTCTLVALTFTANNFLSQQSRMLSNHAIQTIWAEQHGCARLAQRRTDWLPEKRTYIFRFSLRKLIWEYVHFLHDPRLDS